MEQQEKETVRPAANWLQLDDAMLLSSCEVDCYRASGPGGQKRNKTSSAVRLRHLPTGLIVVGTESRSQHENRVRAIRRLREAIALELRNPIQPGAEPPAAYQAALQRDSSLRVNPKHPDYYRIVQHVLDCFVVSEAQVSRAAEMLRISTGQLIRFLKNDEKLWQKANQLREQHGLSSLR